jgi:hypothetical protein
MNNPPAFPSVFDHERGMTLRDYFAAKAMQGMFANPDDGHENYDLSYEDYVKEIARCAYKMADAMLKAREA